jgi:putative transposase
MARQLRVTFDGAIYHVYDRGASKQDTYLDDADRRAFLDLLGAIYEKYEVEIHAYCLMSNHYHLLVRTPHGNISEAMRYLNSVYTMRFNRRHGSDGSLFRGRFGAQLIADDDYLRVVSSYIHLNPVKAGMVDWPSRYRWSSYVAYLDGLGAPAWFFDALVLGAFGGRKSHRAHVESMVNGNLAELDLSVPVLASPEVTERLLDETSRCTETDASRRRAEHTPSADRIARLVALECGVSPASLCLPTRGRPNTPRDIAISLAQSVAGLSHEELAEEFGYSNAMSLATALNRFRSRRRSHAKVETVANEVERAVIRGLTPLVIVSDV